MGGRRALARGVPCRRGWRGQQGGALRRQDAPRAPGPAGGFTGGQKHVLGIDGQAVANAELESNP